MGERCRDVPWRVWKLGEQDAPITANRLGLGIIQVRPV